MSAAIIVKKPKSNRALIRPLSDAQNMIEWLKYILHCQSKLILQSPSSPMSGTNQSTWEVRLPNKTTVFAKEQDKMSLKVERCCIMLLKRTTLREGKCHCTHPSCVTESGWHFVGLIHNSCLLFRHFGATLQRLVSPMKREQSRHNIRWPNEWSPTGEGVETSYLWLWGSHSEE